MLLMQRNLIKELNNYSKLLILDIELVNKKLNIYLKYLFWIVNYMTLLQFSLTLTVNALLINDNAFEIKVQ